MKFCFAHLLLRSPSVRLVAPLSMMSDKDGGGRKKRKTGVGFKSENDEDVSWPPNDTMESIKDLLGDDKYDEMMEHVATAEHDSRILAIINHYIVKCVGDKEESDDGSNDSEETKQPRPIHEKFTQELIAAHSASTVALVFCRTSMNQFSYNSQVLRANQAPPLLTEHKYDNETYIWDPNNITGRLISVGKRRSGNYEAHYNELYDTITSHVASGKKVVVLMIDYKRLHRDIPIALKMVKELESIGENKGDVKIMPMDTFEFETSLVLKTVHKISIEQEEAEEEGTGANHIDAAKGLRGNVKEPFLADQNALDTAYSNYTEKSRASATSRIDVGSMPIVKQAGTAGDEMVSSFNYDEDNWDFLEDLREGVTKEEAYELAKTYRKSVELSPGYTPGKQNKRVAYSRSSDTGDDYSNETSRKYVKINKTPHPEKQLAKSLLYLSKHDEDVNMPDEFGELFVPKLIQRSEDDGNGKQSSSATVVIISSKAQRRDDVIKEVLAIAESIAKKEVHSLLVTITTRLSGYGGYIYFIKSLCDQTGTKLINTECLGIDPIEIADAEDERAKKLEKLEVHLFCMLPVLSNVPQWILIKYLFHSIGSACLARVVNISLVVGWQYRIFERWSLDGCKHMLYLSERIKAANKSGNTSVSLLWTALAAILSPTAVLHVCTGITLLAAYCHVRSLEMTILSNEL